MADNDDFLDDEFPADAVQDVGVEPWVMMLVDDEPDIHTVTKLALQGVTYLGRPLDFVSCYTGEEAITTLAKRDDVAVVLLDVVMETDHAGLDCARRIREELGNTETRVVLRTGQPGMAPEREVILGYDINDYKAKTDLTADRLFTTVIAALRGYADIRELNQFRRDALGALNDQLELLTTTVNLVPDAMVHLDPLGLITTCNAPFADLADAEPDDIIGEISADVLPEALVAALAPPENGRSTMEIELQDTGGASTKYFVTVVAHLMPDAVANDLVAIVTPLAEG